MLRERSSPHKLAGKLRNAHGVCKLFLQEARDFWNISSESWCSFTLCWSDLEDIRKLNWRNWLCFRLFTFDNAFWWSRAAFVEASFYLKGHWKYCDSKSLSKEFNWCQLSSVAHFQFCASLIIVAYVSAPLYNRDNIVFVLLPLSLSSYGEFRLKMLFSARQNNFNSARRV